MKKRISLRIFFIGSLHMILYLYIVPFMIYPKFGKSGIAVVAGLAVFISAIVFGTLFFDRKNKGEGNGRY